MKSIVFCTVTALAVAGGGLGLASGAGADSDEGLRAQLVDTGGKVVGHVKLSFEEGDTQVKVSVDLPPSMAGFHGFHIHSVGTCTGPAFTSAGGHLGEVATDPTHRHRNHDGDLPVLLVNSDGHASARVSTDRLSLDEVRDVAPGNGSAVIIHAAPDNYANIPTRYSVANPVPVYPGTTTDAATLATGDSGARIACGVLK